MIYLRSALFLLGQVTSTLPFLFVALFGLMLPATQRASLVSGWAVFVTWWLKVTCGLKHEVIGLENLPNTPCVIACNHQSEWETIAPQTFLPPHTWVLKRELFSIPIFGWALWATKPIAIDRSRSMNALDQVTSQGKEKLAEGRYVLIFPEGTRMPYSKPGKYRQGAALLAREAGVPIVPLSHNAGKYWSKNNWLKKPGVIRCYIGQPVYLENKSDREVTVEIKEWIVSQ